MRVRRRRKEDSDQEFVVQIRVALVRETGVRVNGAYGGHSCLHTIDLTPCFEVL